MADDAHAGQRNPRSSTRDALVGALLFGLALGWFSLGLDATFNLRDEGYLLSMGARVAQGEVPHRDFADAYGPGVFAATAIPLALGGGEILAVRWWVAGIKALAVVLAFLILRRVTPLRFAAAGAAVSIVYWGRGTINLNSPFAALYTLPVLMLGLFALLRAARSPTRMNHVVAGLAAGSAILFKQSLAVMCGAGAVLAVAAIGALDPPRTRSTSGAGAPHGEARPSPFETRVGVALFGVCGLLVLVPTAAFTTLRSYLLHLLPIHLLMLVVGASVLRAGLARPLRTIVVDRVLPFVGGALIVPFVLAMVYAGWGALPELIDDMFVFPSGLRNYAEPAPVPPASLVLFFGGLGAIAAAILRGQRSSQARRRALALGGVVAIGAAIFVVPHRNPDLYDFATLWRSALFLDWSWPSILVVAALLPVYSALRAEDGEERTDTIRNLLPISFFTAFLCFQIFPRAGQNAWTCLGALTLLGCVLIHRTWRWAARADATRTERRFARALCLLIPLWAVAPVAGALLDDVWSRDDPLVGHLEVALPHASWITLSRETAHIEEFGQVRALVEYVRQTEPADAPLLVLGPEYMLYFVTDRPHVAPDLDFLLYSAAIRMLPASGFAILGDGRLLDALASSPDALVVQRAERRPNAVRRAIPELHRVLQTNYVPDARFGPYTVLRREGRSANATPQ